jgi:hypothetical protein
MAELVRTNQLGIIAAVEGVLIGEEVPFLVADRNVSVIEGSIGAIQMRVLVPDEYADVARALLTEAELGEWLTPEKRRR